MKPHEEAKKRIINEWLRRAGVDIAVAERLLSDEAAFLNAVTFHCQQAAEKYLKALLTCWETEFPKTHELARLIKLIETRDAKLATSLLDVTMLTPYGVELQYPGDRPDATPDEAREAVELVCHVRDTILPLLQLESTEPGQG